MKTFRLSLFVLALVAAGWASQARALEPGQILLIINKNSPDSAKLAAEYTALRHIPDGRTVALDVPRADEMDFDTYERNVVPPILQFIEDHHLQDQIKCLVTFLGVPYRVAAKHNSPDDVKELAQLRAQQMTSGTDLQHAVEELEKQPISLDPTFKPSGGNDVNSLARRVQTAANFCAIRIDAMDDLTKKADATRQFTESIEKIGGPAELDARFGAAQRAAHHDTTEETEKWMQLHQTMTAAITQVHDLERLRYDPDARAKVRQIIKDDFGLLGAAQIIQAQVIYFQTDQTNSATDNELALLWWDYYPRQGWQMNPMYVGIHAKAKGPPVMMVMRLDASAPDIVEKMMQTSVDVEKKGLHGVVALDARGLSPKDPYGAYDEKIRHLAQLLRAKTDLKIVLDDNPEVFPPHSVEDVALYCGWYSVRHYIPGCDFNPGAVGFHIASFEMVDLHQGNSGEWVSNLLHDGVVGTLGPCSEPYLLAFPAPDEFFPLLLTGKLPLAEVYWRTNPLTSWMMSCIGDPLYTPYKVDPAMKVEDLPAPLQAIFQPTPPQQP